MISTATTHGSPYTYDPDYDIFGQPQAGVLYDWSLRCWRRVVAQPLATHRDRVTPVDPDVLLTEERWEDEQPSPKRKYTGSANTKAAHEARKANSAGRHAELQKRVVAYLMVHGPADVRVLGPAVGAAYGTMKKHMAVREGAAYCRLEKGWQTFWGVKGVHDVRHR